MAKIKVVTNGTKKDIILNSAAAIFKRKGYRAASLRELADAVGVEAPSLYNHIGSKAELLQDICFEVATDYTNHLKIVVESNAKVIDKLAVIIRFHVRKLSTDFDKVYVSDHEWKQLPQKQLETFLASRKAYEKSLIELVEQGIAQKELKNHFPSITVLTILSAVRGLELRQRHKSEFSIEELENTMIDLLLNGIKK
ncbi:TetR/AcrR family transcriptional regulator [Ferruginibacter yonginensis]|uniref:TetR/AcrR family transcriptional regulator n=1 Tax=Ferruginibacter yonginensis TaxID=1310416 RepID=A0ABV8QT31_9BACT